MKTSLFCPLQTWISEAMLEAEGGWGKYPKTMYACARKENTCANKRVRKREIRARYTCARIRKVAGRLVLRTNINRRGITIYCNLQASAIATI